MRNSSRVYESASEGKRRLSGGYCIISCLCSTELAGKMMPTFKEYGVTEILERCILVHYLKKIFVLRYNYYVSTNPALVNTLAKGLLTEAKVYSALTEFGYDVVFPARVTRWDLGWEDGDRLIRVQCKTGSLQNGAINFWTASRGNKNTGRQDYRGQVDYFAVYVQALDKVYLIPVAEVGLTHAILRISSPRNSQSKRIKWAKDYEIKKNLSKEI